MSEVIYILVNSSMPDLVKIGRTARSADERAAELSQATNMPTRFVVAYEEHVSDGPLAEQLIHELLAERGFRVAINREFFNAPLKIALRAVQEVVTRFPVSSASIGAPDGGTEYSDSLDEHALLMRAIAYFKGDEDTLQDDAKAFKYFARAASVGSSTAEKFLSMGYVTGRIGKLSGRKALEHLERAVELGDKSSYKDMWEIYSGQTKAQDAISPENAELCYQWYLDNTLEEASAMDLMDYVTHQHWVACGMSSEDEAHPLASREIGGQHTARVLDVLVERLNSAMRDCASSGDIPSADNSYSPVGVVYVEAIIKTIFIDNVEYMRRVLTDLTEADLRICFADAKDPDRLAREFTRYLSKRPLQASLAVLSRSAKGPESTAEVRTGFWRRLFAAK